MFRRADKHRLMGGTEICSGGTPARSESRFVRTSNNKALEQKILHFPEASAAYRRFIFQCFI
jgi:hypothetical protein